MLKKTQTEFYVGTLVWILSIVIAFIYWVQEDSEILLALTPTNGIVVVVLFLTYFAGFTAAHGIFAKRLPTKHKVIALGVAGIAAGLLSAFYFVHGMIGCMFIMLIVFLSRLIDQKWAMVVAVATPTLFVSIDYWISGHFIFGNIALFSVVNILALTISYRALAEEQAKRRSERLVRELEATQILLSATTKRDERLRISRNLHDILGHQLTALNLQLEVASHVSSDEKQKHIDNAKTISSNLLSNVRDTVSEFRGDTDLKLPKALESLAKDIPGLDVTLTIEWDETLANELQVEAIFRCAQEALTNTMRHSNASECEMTLSSDGHNIVLTVKDNGHIDTQIEPGNGLKGLQERAKKLDGKLYYCGDTCGFQLTLTLPIGDN